MKNVKSLSFLRHLTSCRYFLVIKKRRVKKAEANCKIYDVINWETNNYNTHNVQYPKKSRESDNGISSVSRIQHEKYFSRIIHNMWWRN